MLTTPLNKQTWHPPVDDVSAIYSHCQQFSVDCKRADYLFDLSWTAERLIEMRVLVFSHGQAIVSIRGWKRSERRVVCPHSAWTFIIISVSCSSPCVYISMHTHSYIHMCAQSCRVEKVVYGFSADFWAEEKQERRGRGGDENKEEGRKWETRESVALSVLNRGEWAVLHGGCVVNWRPLLAETQMGDFPSGRSHVWLGRKTLLTHTRTQT